MGTGGPGDVIVTQTVRDLVSGGSLRFAEHGVHELKGVPGTWPLFMLTGIDGDIVRTPAPRGGGRRYVGGRRRRSRRWSDGGPSSLGVVAALVASSAARRTCSLEEDRPPSDPVSASIASSDSIPRRVP